jgi:predicted protein tyrosine phosphatase
VESEQNLSDVCAECLNEKQVSNKLQVNFNNEYCDECYKQRVNKKLEQLLEHKFLPVEIVKITDKIYLGNYSGAAEKERLKFIGITHILCAGDGLLGFFEEDFKYKIFQIKDSFNQDIAKYFIESIKFINEGDKVYIHCHAGVNRSVSILAAYLMWKNKQNFTDVIKFIKDKRPEASPISNFKNALINFHYFLELCQYDIFSEEINLTSEFLSNCDPLKLLQFIQKKASKEIKND